jgi:predicted flap endonuclease-1-like 5' DNA nuclease
MAALTTVEGIGEAYAAKLKEIGIQTTEQLLEKGSTPAGRKEIADKTGISPALILKWVNRVDLARIKGIGEEYADLLEAAGVDTVPELAQRNPQNLYESLQRTNEQKKLVRQLPTLSQVEDWIGQAKKLPRVVQY